MALDLVEAVYLSPLPPLRGGIADYAHVFCRAMETYAGHRLVRPDFLDGACDTFRSYVRLRREVRRFAGHPPRGALVHAEIGRFQQSEFHALRLLGRWRPDLRYVVTAHDPDILVAPVATPLSGGGAGLAYKLARLLDLGAVGRGLRGAGLSRVGAFVVLTEAGRAALHRHGPGDRPVHVVPHVDLRTVPRLDPSRTLARHPLTVLFLGFWGPNKGIETLLDAVAQARSRTATPFRLVMAGQPPEGQDGGRYVRSIRERIAALGIAPLVVEKGYVPDHHIDSAFDEADIVVLPYNRSRPGSASGVVIRAMSSGVAIVASDVGSMRHELGAGSRGVLVEPENAADLSRALVALLDDGPRRSGLGHAAQTHIVQERSMAAVGERMIRTYQTVVADVAGCSP